MDKQHDTMAPANHDNSLRPIEIGTGSTVWRTDERDAPCLFALIYEKRSMAIPTAPETDTMTFAIFNESIDEPAGSIDIQGRAGMNRWYLTHVGHEPDKEPDGERPITELIVNVARHLMLRFYEEGLAPDTANPASK